MARFGQGVNAALGTTDYSGYLAGALQGARGVAAGGESMGRGIANLGQEVGKGVKELMKKREEKGLIDDTVDMIMPMFASQEARDSITPGATSEDIETIARKKIKVLGAVEANKWARDAQESGAFGAGMDAGNQQITEQVATFQPNDLPPASYFDLPDSEGFSAPQSMNVVPAPSSVNDFMETGKITPKAPYLVPPGDFGFTGGAPAPEGVAVPEATAPTVPKSLEEDWGYNSETGKLIARGSFIEDTLRDTKALQLNLEKQESIKKALKKNSKSVYRGGRGGHRIESQGLDNDEKIGLSDRLSKLRSQQGDLQKSLTSKNSDRERVAELNNPDNINKRLEVKATERIEKSLEFAYKQDLPEVEKKEWSMFKTVMKDVSREGTDAEKTAAFVAAYSKIAPMNASAYAKIEKIFDKTPVIHDIGNGKMIVTIEGRSFMTDASKKKNASLMELEGETAYNALLSEAQRMGFDVFMADPRLKANFNRLHNQFGPRSEITGERLPLGPGLYGTNESQTNGGTSKRFTLEVVNPNQ